MRKNIISLPEGLAHILLSSPIKGRCLALVVAIVVTGAASVIGSGWLFDQEERYGALGWTLFSDNTPEERITLVVVDEASIAEIGPWPWARDVMSELVDAIDAAGAQLQIHDIVYPEARPGDTQLLSSLTDARGAVIAQVPALNDSSESSRVGVMSHGVAAPGCSIAGLTLAQASSYVAPAEIFSSVPKGHNAALIERDGSVRMSPALVCVDDVVYPSLTLSAFMQLGMSSEWAVEVSMDNGLLGPHAYIEVGGYPGLRIPVDSNGNMRVDYSSAPETFRAVSASDLLLGRAGADLLDNAWVILGGTAFGMSDIVPTPYSGATFGIELQARMLASVLDMETPFTPVAADLIQAAIAIIFAGLLLSLPRASGVGYMFWLVSLSVLLPVLALCIHIYFLAAFAMWIGWASPALFGFLSVAAIVLYELAVARLERARVYQNLASYLPLTVAREVAISLPSSQVDATRKNVTLLHADIRNFAAFGEARPPEEIAAILHYFSTRVNEVVELHGGKVVEFRGDSVLAMWEGADSDSANAAYSASRVLQNALSDKLLSEHNLNGLEQLGLGIGIDQGPVLIGSIGPASRRSFTVLGDTVNTTIRIQEMTEELAQPILVGSSAARHLVDRNLQSQGSFLLAGLTVPHVLFAPPPSAEVLHLTSKKGESAR